jgi:hypothetical protein
MFFASRDVSINDNRICDVRDISNLVSSSPPEYSVFFIPSNLYDLRPGDERCIRVFIKSTINPP